MIPRNPLNTSHLHLNLHTVSGRHGRAAENLSIWFLKNHHFQILERNFNSYTGEVDIIAAKHQNNFLSVHFIEVKAHFYPNLLPPQNAVTRAKQKKIVSAAHYWILKHRFIKAVYRFDIIAIQKFGRHTPRIRFFKNAFVPRQDFGW